MNTDTLEHRLSLVIRDVARAKIKIKELDIVTSATVGSKRWAEVRLSWVDFHDLHKDKETTEYKERSWDKVECWHHPDVKVYCQLYTGVSMLNSFVYPSG
jgi:hypothetical protein